MEEKKEIKTKLNEKTMKLTKIKVKETVIEENC